MAAATLSLQLVCGLLLGSSLAQDARVSILPRNTRANSESAKDTAARIRVDSSLVLVPVLVTDGNDQLITGLERSSFRVYDNDVEQEIRHFAIEDAPVSVVLLFDTSGSMSHKLQNSRVAASQFLKASNPDDEFALVKFDDRAQLLVPLTSESGDIDSRLAFLEPHGRTALLDAVGLALDELKRAHNARKAILIISDGGDNHSRNHERELRRRVREADVQIYAIGILESYGYRTLEEANGPHLLSDIAAQTGGRLFEIGGTVDLPGVAARIGTALRNQYVLGYSPSTLKRDGRHHRITVKLAQPHGSTKLRASFRSSYFAPLQ